MIQRFDMTLEAFGKQISFAEKLKIGLGLFEIAAQLEILEITNNNINSANLMIKRNENSFYLYLTNVEDLSDFGRSTCAFNFNVSPCISLKKGKQVNLKLYSKETIQQNLCFVNCNHRLDLFQLTLTFFHLLDEKVTARSIFGDLDLTNLKIYDASVI